ncbi:hypothetical protein BJY01DRAFT_247463 [Aspergillus pseudoustus]|uniref:WW domain-containing protein n=1 Tax=Aspergillus pseudoustus TaxID=1810923 RepID=A0ABR4K0K9_9EURO
MALPHMIALPTAPRLLAHNRQPTPPLPLPTGWVQEWELTTRRAYLVEVATGRAEWILPLDDGHDETRNGADGYAYPAAAATAVAVASPPPPSAPLQVFATPQYPPQGYPQGVLYTQGQGQDTPGQAKKDDDDDDDNTGMLLTVGAVGLAIGAVGGAILGHELMSTTPRKKKKRRKKRVIGENNRIVC